MRVALKFAYDGKRFSGYARQPGQRTIEGELLRMLGESDIILDSKTSCFRTASRTDRGVSALGNVCAFDTMVPQKDILRTFSKDVSEIFVYGIHQVDPGFYPRHAKYRQYRYYLRRKNLDVDKVLSAAVLFTGEHNFQNFARVEPLKNPVRTIDNIIITMPKDFFIIDLYAQTFLWNQIRRIISALEKIGTGALTEDQVHHTLEHPDVRVDFQLAAAEPLILKDVMYDFSFEYVNDYSKKLRMFEQQIVSLL